MTALVLKTLSLFASRRLLGFFPLKILFSSPLHEALLARIMHEEKGTEALGQHCYLGMGQWSNISLCGKESADKL